MKLATTSGWTRRGALMGWLGSGSGSGSLRGAVTVGSAKTALDIARAPALQSAPESAGLLQQRLKLFYGMLAATFVGSSLAAAAAAMLIEGSTPAGSVTHPVKLLNLIVPVSAAAVFWRFGRRNAPLGMLQWLDVSLPVAIAWGLCLTMIEVPIGYASAYASFLLVVFVLTLRAALVPSPPLRTVLVACGSVLPVVWHAYRAALSDPLFPAALSPGLFAAGAAIWGAMLGAATTITSRVIYGLQHDVRTARRLGQYTLLDKLGEGGMGCVYRARHAMLRRPTAIKLLPQERAGAESIARFELEVQHTSMLSHPNVVAIYDYGRTTDGVFFYAMEYVDGVTLEDLVRRDGPQPEARVIHILVQLASALAEAHRLGLVHRDVKPANVLVTDRGGVHDWVKVLDFGLVKQVGGGHEARLTRTDAIPGTPAYLAPETISAPRSVGSSVDIYGLGGVGYYLLTGGPMFHGTTVLEVAYHHMYTNPDPPSQRRGAPISSELEALILACLGKDPGERPHALTEQLTHLSHRHAWGAAESAAWWRAWRHHEQTSTPVADTVGCSLAARREPPPASLVHIAREG